MLFPNINIRQTIENVIEKIKELKINISEITILKTTESKNNYITTAFNEKYFSTIIHEYSYSEYVWNYCIEDICKKKFEIDPVPNYIEQSIILNKNNDIEEIQDNVVQYLVKEIKENTFPSSRLIVGPGGIGKSSLCMELVKKLNTDFENKSVLLIMSENIRSLDNVKTLIQNNVIDSLYKLYNFYMNLINSEVNYDQKTFELSILCGNLIIIIDGLDEFVSIFQEQFDTNEFLKSIHDLHLELGQSLVILTSRKNEIIEKINLSEIGIERIDLLGFDKDHLEKYSRKYFKNIDNAEKKSLEFIESVNDFTQGEDNGRISPFMASIFAYCIKNDLYGTGKMKGLGKTCPIPYTNYLTREDFLVYQIFEREKVRHKLDFEISDIIDILSEMFVTNYSSKMSLRELLTQLEIIFDSRSIEILNKLKLNPFFDSDGEFLIVKNDFIVKYFSLLYLLDRFIKGHMTDSMKRIFSSSNFFESEYKNFISYCQNNKESCQDKIKIYILNFLQRDDLTILDKKVIGNLCNLYLNISSINGVERVTEVTRELFNTNSEDKIYNLYIYGDYPALDFRDMKVSNSEFVSYPNFVKSRFNQDTLFAYSKFDLSHDIQYLNSEISNAKFESTCDLGNLHDKLKQIQSEKVSTRETILQELRKFLLPFFKGAYFTDVKKDHMYFSRTIKKLSKEKFDDFLKKLWIEIKIEKSDEIYYQINQNLKDSIRGFLTNNMPDDTIEDIVEYLES